MCLANVSIFFQQILIVHYSRVRCWTLWGYVLNRHDPCLQEAYGLAREVDKSTVQFKTLAVPARSGPGRAAGERHTRPKAEPGMKIIS